MIRSTVKAGPAKGQDSETYMSDYQEVDGLVVPYYIEVRYNGQTAQKITLETVAFNEKIDETFFAFPKK